MPAIDKIASITNEQDATSSGHKNRKRFDPESVTYQGFNLAARDQIVIPTGISNYVRKPKRSTIELGKGEEEGMKIQTGRGNKRGN